MKEAKDQGWALVAKLMKEEENLVAESGQSEYRGLNGRFLSLLNIAVFLTNGDERSLRQQFEAALLSGISVHEIMETIQHCALLNGFPPSLKAMSLLKEVVDDQ
ncbi:carboxymuconolactone decarboxylase family protein [Terribacillus sp. DMT04]|uniref:carboxymuconolactone decarboxylase family protein n=1 Tax=Terribacillus sp. DMT04 TaxID=2850441 RepID=UPI001C2BDEED|nr:carboxymuconolactone decarboxylase family protein [Terribacillus sp. DMT04]QXE02460.1 carboxymuconolactone decarboxylase family protein [Terribacillus sp. DMT04]